MSEDLLTIKDKLSITGIMQLITGLHIGVSMDFSPIGAVDNVVIRDPVSKQPIVPGSSLKGKIRSLLAADTSESVMVPKIEEEGEKLQRLFGMGGKKIRRSRLQFFDLFLTQASCDYLKQVDSDLYMTEIKFENEINRMTAIANPRQLERVPAGAQFDFRLMYVVENPEDVLEDIKLLARGLQLLQLDYLGQGGSRGNGRVRFTNLNIRSELNSGIDLTPAREALSYVSQS